MTENPELAFFKVFDRSIMAWSILNSVRRAASLGASEHSYQAARSMETLIHGPDASKYLHLHGIETADDRLRERIVEEARARAAKDAAWGLDAVSVTFAHTTVDQAALGYLRVCAMVAPDDWWECVDDQKFSLKAFRGSSAQALFAQTLTHYLNSVVDGESLVNKCKRLHRLCKTFDYPDEYKFDLDRVERFNKTRNDIIHGDLLYGPLPGVEDELQYFQKTTLYLMTLVTNRYGLKLNPAFLQHGGS